MRECLALGVHKGVFSHRESRLILRNSLCVVLWFTVAYQTTIQKDFKEFQRYTFSHNSFIDSSTIGKKCFGNAIHYKSFSSNLISIFHISPHICISWVRNEENMILACFPLTQRLYGSKQPLHILPRIDHARRWQQDGARSLGGNRIWPIKMHKVYLKTPSLCWTFPKLSI